MSDSKPTPIADPKSATDFRNVLGQLPTGVTVVTAKADERLAGVTIGSFVSISLMPPLVGFFLDVGAGSWSVIEEAGSFCVNVLGEHQTELSNLMASANPDKFAGLKFSESSFSGAPQLDGITAVLDCSVEREELVGDHRLIVGRVEHLGVLADAKPALVYCKGQYGSFRP